MTIVEQIKSRYLGELTRVRRDIHAHPETAFEERRTADVIAAQLESCGIEVHRGLGKTGVVGRLRCGPGGASGGTRSIGLRADMDALPMQEKNSFAHRSTHAGKMHACGHDGHTAMLLGAARHLAATRVFEGTAVFIFQPAEEGEAGGKAMIDDGLFERFPVDAVFGMHNWPGMPAGRFGLRAGPMMASSDTFEIVIAGRGSHAAMPHEAVDPVITGAALVQSLQTIVSRNLHPVDSGVISVTQFHGGEAYNVIPEEVVLRGTTRAFRPEVRDQLEHGMRRVCAGIAAAHGAQIRLDYRRRYPPLVNAGKESDICTRVLSELVGRENVDANLIPTMGAEDFAFMLQEKPGCYIFIGNGADDASGKNETGATACMLHNAHYDFNDAIIPLGAAYWVKLVEHLLPAGAGAA